MGARAKGFEPVKIAQISGTNGRNTVLLEALMLINGTFMRERLFRCGDFLEGDIYPVFQQAGKRQRRYRATSEVQQKLNLKNSRKKLLRLMRANFEEDDLHLTLTFRENPEDNREAERRISNFLQRIRLKYKSSGIELRYLRVTEQGKNGRFHVHIIITGDIDRDILERLWGHGYANAHRLQYENDGLSGLSNYLTKERVNFRRWSGSKNLIRPEPEQHDGRIEVSGAEALAEMIEAGDAYAYFENAYPGYALISCSAERNGINRGVYLQFEMRKIKSGKTKRPVTARSRGDRRLKKPSLESVSPTP